MVLLWIAQARPKLGELTEAQSMFLAAFLTLECPEYVGPLSAPARSS